MRQETNDEEAARTKTISKAQAVREYLAEHPRAKNKAIVDALEKRGISTGPGYVSQIRRQQYQDKVRVLDTFDAAAGTDAAAKRIKRLRKDVKTVAGDTCFVMMPYAAPQGNYYTRIYEPAIRKAGLTPVRADADIFGTGKIMDQIWTGINAAKVFVAELTTKNPNVFYELGLAHALEKPVVLVSSNEEDVPFDLQHIRVIYYDVMDPFWGQKLLDKVAENIRSAIKNPEEAIFKTVIKKTPESPGPLGEVVFKGLNLSPDARKKLGRSKFIQGGGTRDALMQLVDSAKAGSTILAICGNKGDYSGEYYRRNFTKCKRVKRVFSYDAILSEITNKHVRYALDGLKMHLDKKTIGGCEVSVFLIPKGKGIKDIGGHNFDPPPSFGVAILQGKNSPSKAVVHWEMDAVALRDLISIEGVIIDNGQKELLEELVELHESIVRSNIVLPSETASERSEIDRICKHLEQNVKTSATR